MAPATMSGKYCLKSCKPVHHHPSNKKLRSPYALPALPRVWWVVWPSRGVNNVRSIDVPGSKLVKKGNSGNHTCKQLKTTSPHHRPSLKNMKDLHNFRHKDANDCFHRHCNNCSVVKMHKTCLITVFLKNLQLLQQRK